VTPAGRLGTLAAVCVAQFMLLLDVTIVNVALPSIQRELGVTAGSLQWVVNAYVLMLASLILVAGTLGDRVGRRRLLLVGLVVFTAASAGCALASDDPELVAFRAVQGLGAALMAPLALAILADAYPPERRAWAIGIWAAVAGVGFGAGPIVGGALIGAFDWSAIFWVNVPMGVAGILLTRGFVRESRDPTPRRLDLSGAALAAAAIFCLTFGLVQTERHAWDSAPTLAFLVAGAALLAAFAAREATAREPMLPLGILRRRPFALATVTYAALYAGLAAALFYVSLFFQDVAGWSALRTGVSWLAMNVPFLLASLFAGRVQRRFGAPRIAAAGAALGGLATAGFGLLTTGSSYLAALPSYLLLGIGYGLAVPAVSTMGIAAIEPERVGLASGVLNTARQFGAAIGLAALVSIGATVARTEWSDHARTLDPGLRSRAAELAPIVAGGDSAAVARRLGAQQVPAASDAFVSGMRAAMLAAGAFTLLAAALTALARPRAHPPPAPAPARVIERR
jgi:DHA2 family methylenomycin A resistance protein-like MFS transporter